MSDAENQDGLAPNKEEQYVPPDQLPPPMEVEKQTGALGITLAIGLAVACAMGVAMFAVGQFLYIYILYNWAAGAAVGWALTRAPKAGYFNKQALFICALLCSVVVYLAFNVALYVQILSEIPEAEGELGFIQFILLRAEHDTLIGDMQPGTTGNFIVWTIELAITIFYAWRKVAVSIIASQFDSVPSEVTSLVLHSFNEGMSESNVRSELAKRGWTRMEDQDRAFRAAQAVVQLAQQAGGDEAGG